MDDGAPLAGMSAPPEMSDLRQQLVEAQRLALAGTTTAMLAHEFNNLMTPVLARAIDAVQRDDPATMKKALERTVAQVQKAQTLMKYVLRITRPASDSADSCCCVADAVESALLEAVRPFAKDNIEVKLFVPRDLHARIRDLLLEQVLLNLLINARDAMVDRRGEITIFAERVRDEVHLSVSDNGRGIAPEAIEERFAPFLAGDARADANWRRVGLGLQVCRLIVQDHHGRISVSANAERGCTFEVVLPVAEPKEG